MKPNLLITIVLFIAIVFAYGCNNSSEPDSEEPDYLFKATFTNDWLQAGSGQAIIFLSDNDGNVLAEKTWSGNTSFEMYPDDNLSKTAVRDISTINVTTVVRSSTGDRVSLSTNMDIPVGSSWTFKGVPTVDYNSPPYSVELDFENVPAYENYYIISSKWDYRFSTSSNLDTPFNFDFFESPMDIYVKLNTANDGVKYLWLDNVVSGSRQDDLSNMNPAASKQISLPQNYGYRKQLYGFPVAGDRYEGRYLLDYGRDYNPTNLIEVYYPGQYYTDYRTVITLMAEGRDEEWYESTYGEIPNVFTKVDATLNYVSTSVDDFDISASGDYIETLSIWTSENMQHFWYVYSDKNDVKYKLPQLPNSVIQLFSLDRNSFELWLVDLIKQRGLASYSEILSTLFESNDYFYNVVDHYARYTKYAPDGLLKQANKKLQIEFLNRDPHFNF